MKTIFLLVKSQDGKKTFWNHQGVAFAPNKDGSVNFKLDMFPALTFQMREQAQEETPNAG